VWYRTIIFLAYKIVICSFYMSSPEGVPVIRWRLLAAGKGKFVFVHCLKAVINL
jgi:hypothetical protein